MNIIQGNKIGHSYFISGKKIRSLKEVTFSVKKGEYIALIGKNGCCKSTLAKHINVLLPLQTGQLEVIGLDAREKGNAIKIRKKCGMVFQNPDNQFVSSIVEEDIKFGMKNFGLPSNAEDVKNALKLVGMEGFEKRMINSLSGGQKQRIALAGILALKPEIIILDEATTMLPPEARKEMLDIVNDLHKSTEMTFIMITQYIEEAVGADRVILMSKGRIVADGPKEDILSDVELLEKNGITPPYTVRLYHDLLEAGIDLGECPLTNERMVELLCQLK